MTPAITPDFIPAESPDFIPQQDVNQTISASAQAYQPFSLARVAGTFGKQIASGALRPDLRARLEWMGSLSASCSSISKLESTPSMV